MSNTVVFDVDPIASRMVFKATSNVHPIEGEGRGIHGVIEVSLDEGQPDLSRPVVGAVALEVGDLVTGNIAYDTEIRRRLDWRANPTIEGAVTSVEEIDGRYLVTGELSFHGVKRQLTVDMSVTVEDGLLEASWRQAVDIRDFGLRPPRVLMLRVDPEVEVNVEIRATAREP